MQYGDLGDLGEDDRIKVIGHSATALRKVVGFVVEDRGKADRYVDKLRAAFPDINIIEPGAPFQGSILVKVGPK